MYEHIDVNEHCLTVADVAERLNVNHDTVRPLFLHESGVIAIYCPRKKTRVYTHCAHRESSCSAPFLT